MSDGNGQAHLDLGFGLSEQDGTYTVIITIGVHPLIFGRTSYTDRQEALGVMREVASVAARFMFLLGYPGHLGDIEDDGPLRQ
jgi:hypothetical protein